MINNFMTYIMVMRCRLDAERATNAAASRQFDCSTTEAAAASSSSSVATADVIDLLPMMTPREFMQKRTEIAKRCQQMSDHQNHDDAQDAAARRNHGDRSLSMDPRVGQYDDAHCRNGLLFY